MQRETEKKLQAVTLLISGGWNASDACETTGLSYATFRKYGCAAAARPNALQGRNEKMIALYREGKTLEEIGLAYGLTRERVRQILAKCGVTKQQGGRSLRARTRDAMRVEKRRAKRDANALETYGCDYDTAVSLNDGLGLRGEGTKSRFFTQQRLSAKNRGIEWKLTFPEWCAFWQDSGKWDLRGRGKGHYCMSRFLDSGAYELGNIKICSNEENIREGYIHTPASERMVLRAGFTKTQQRQIEVYELHRQGKTNKEIAIHLGLAVQYVTNALSYGRRRAKELAAQELQVAA
jgi:DNA-binding CsgD family transcriptional regulator